METQVGLAWDCKRALSGIVGGTAVRAVVTWEEFEECVVDNLVGIIVGFALTTLVGGWWAAKLQERSWARQNDVRLRESENERAGTACQELMSLLDRRLYRMQRLLWAATASGESEGQNLELERRREEYADVLFAWNDRLNTNLSLTGSFFGDEARAYLDQLYEDFKRVGREIEEIVRSARSGGDTTRQARRVASELEGREVGSLNDRVYQFGLILMSHLREGQVGRYAPYKSIPRATTS